MILFLLLTYLLTFVANLQTKLFLFCSAFSYFLFIIRYHLSQKPLLVSRYSICWITSRALRSCTTTNNKASFWWSFNVVRSTRRMWRIFGYTKIGWIAATIRSTTIATSIAAEYDSRKFIRWVKQMLFFNFFMIGIGKVYRKMKT